MSQAPVLDNRYNVFSVGRDRHKPVLVSFFQQIQIPMPEQGQRVLCSEYNKVHDGRVQPVSGYGDWVKRGSARVQRLPQAVCEPLRVKSKYVCVVPVLYDHSGDPPINILPFRQRALFCTPVSDCKCR